MHRDDGHRLLNSTITNNARFESNAPLNPRAGQTFRRSRTEISVFAVLNSEKRNTEDRMTHGEPKRNRPAAFSRLFLILSREPSVHSVGFLRVLCVKFRNELRSG